MYKIMNVPVPVQE